MHLEKPESKYVLTFFYQNLNSISFIFCSQIIITTFLMIIKINTDKMLIIRYFKPNFANIMTLFFIILRLINSFKILGSNHSYFFN